MNLFFTLWLSLFIWAWLKRHPVIHMDIQHGCQLQCPVSKLAIPVHFENARTLWITSRHGHFRTPHFRLCDGSKRKRQNSLTCGVVFRQLFIIPTSGHRRSKHNWRGSTVILISRPQTELFLGGVGKMFFSQANILLTFSCCSSLQNVGSCCLFSSASTDSLKTKIK